MEKLKRVYALGNDQKLTKAYKRGRGEKLTVLSVRTFLTTPYVPRKVIQSNEYLFQLI